MAKKKRQQPTVNVQTLISEARQVRDDFAQCDRSLPLTVAFDGEGRVLGCVQFGPKGRGIDTAEGRRRATLPVLRLNTTTELAGRLLEKCHGYLPDRRKEMLTCSDPVCRWVEFLNTGTSKLFWRQTELPAAMSLDGAADVSAEACGDLLRYLSRGPAKPVKKPGRPPGKTDEVRRREARVIKAYEERQPVYDRNAIAMECGVHVDDVSRIVSKYRKNKQH